ncbi:hypothetical protein [Cellulomonas dongxiuzhuiae]|uniref:ABC transporter permease n=1 Tax=Cellulomonas dongxiuzhuiae TaxID=2819979 RepID=A0ABX8GKB8_9CELL|nr:hypothetical protein [Cellulomonas dongxiuzhuiae]MBO3087957.1 hypothetical protein [Cellulomonas dongxiuzhuiae]MBO3094691.1 hypothetical protein [Cellulomonas dongxiuzhuiae]QWC15694.1 hypothetical protein KKR89_15645 [Cellulomonas dongxiuzhuiae]
MTAAVAPPRVSPTVHTARRLAVALLQMAGWFWGVAVVAIAAGNVIGWAVAGATDVSIAIYARQAATWFPFSLAIMLVAAYLRVHVAAGMTRRTFVRAVLVVEVAAGLAYAAILTTVVLVERAVHDALGWDSVITEVQLADASSPVWALFLDQAVPFVLGNLSGLLVGVVYLRGGAWWGTLTLPLTVGPLLASLYVGGARLMELPGIWTTATDTQALLLLVGLGAALCLVTALVFAAVARRAPVTARP